MRDAQQDPPLETLVAGSGADARAIAMLRRGGSVPGLFWLGGYRSEMTGSKAATLDALGAEYGLAVTRFDYSGHGRSGGEFRHGTITRWLEEAIAVFETTSGPQIVVGSSMGGWIALLLARVLGGSGRIRALVLVAPAVDMTEELMLKGFTRKERRTLAATGLVEQPSAYSDAPYPITRELIEDGRRHLLFGHGIRTGCPVTILQGGSDPDVPRAHALRLLQHLLSDPVTFTLVPDGDHRLSRPEDLAQLRAAVLAHVGAPAEQLSLAFDGPAPGP